MSRTQEKPVFGPPETRSIFVRKWLYRFEKLAERFRNLELETEDAGMNLANHTLDATDMVISYRRQAKTLGFMNVSLPAPSTPFHQQERGENEDDETLLSRIIKDIEGEVNRGLDVDTRLRANFKVDSKKDKAAQIMDQAMERTLLAQMEG
ncbi:hypothetical protein Slin15195_G038350 [Septoria linicola]|uniref:Uncharacterized protein n=1 Tax=Septoria linicola TaxID=215465 RepID=A0A9Q9ATM1_9PEZI|nr:hypothetical protein Slin14017_G119750 [Septoria linicola]USW50516.1 hypothetical protein Slin15195_G038350 [Septoria linicola]